MNANSGRFGRKKGKTPNRFDQTPNRFSALFLAVLSHRLYTRHHDLYFSLIPAFIFYDADFLNWQKDLSPLSFRALFFSAANLPQIMPILRKVAMYQPDKIAPYPTQSVSKRLHSTVSTHIHRRQVFTATSATASVSAGRLSQLHPNPKGK